MKNHNRPNATAVNGQKKNRRGAGSSSVARVENVHMDTKGEKNYTATMTRFFIDAFHVMREGCCLGARNPSVIIMTERRK